MHFQIEVHLPTVPRNRVEAEARLADVLAPFENDYWDWWVIGGRWTGEHDGYRPDKDPVNMKDCTCCNGTGDRPEWVTYVNGVRTFLNDRGLSTDEEWSRQCNGCNGCHGTGREVSMSYADHAEDIMPLSKIRKDLKAYAVVVEGDWIEGDRTPVLKTLKNLGIKGGCLVTVDCHN